MDLRVESPRSTIRSLCAPAGYQMRAEPARLSASLQRLCARCRAGLLRGSAPRARKDVPQGVLAPARPQAAAVPPKKLQATSLTLHLQCLAKCPEHSAEMTRRMVEDGGHSRDMGLLAGEEAVSTAAITFLGDGSLGSPA